MRWNSAGAGLALILAAMFVPGTVAAHEYATLARLDPATVELTRDSTAPVTIWLSRDPVLDKADKRIATAFRGADLKIDLPADTREYVIVEGAAGGTHVVAERLLPLAQVSNFRDIGGYTTSDGHTVRWDKVFRSGAMPAMTDADEALIRQLGITTDVDLRSTDERQIWPDTIDDREGMLFVSNDYPMAQLMKGFMAGNGEHIYTPMLTELAPQFRSFYRRIMAGEGGVLVHCSAGQDRTGVAVALLYDVLGVDRATILADYHLSTRLRRPQFEMTKIDPADFPGNVMAQSVAKMAGAARQPEPLYTRSGASHLAQLFEYIDATYGDSQGYMQQVLGFSDRDIARLRAAMLD